MYQYIAVSMATRTRVSATLSPAMEGSLPWRSRAFRPFGPERQIVRNCILVIRPRQYGTSPSAVSQPTSALVGITIPSRSS